MPYSINEQLAAITALEKWCKTAKEEIREKADANLAEKYEEDGVEKMALKVNGQKVGEFIVTFTNEGFDVVDQEIFQDFCLSNGLATISRSIRPTMMHAAIKVIEGSIEPEHVSDFIQEEIVVASDWGNYMSNVGGRVFFFDTDVEVPGVVFRPRRPKGTQVRKCEPETVFPLLQAMDGGINGLLMGGVE